ncbi:MAG: hypothetical protein HRF40_00730 [Nitrososphaera sp.]|jgi:hypothetical protein
MTHDWYEQQHHKQHNRPRAISPAIATIALIGLAIVAVGAVGGYVMSQSSTLKQDISMNILETHLVQLRKNTNDWNMGISFKNTGTVTITNIRIDMRLNDGTIWTVSGTPFGGSAAPGETKRIDGTMTTAQITAGQSYALTIVVDGTVAGEVHTRTYTTTVIAEGL